MKVSINFFFLGILLLPFFVAAQVPQVPKAIHFADMTLRLNEQARREIQADVDALYRNSAYFQIKLDRVNLYMPTVERVLQEQGVPTDLKYLVIQESSLIPDAVSTSNAVGFWQFKKGTAEEVFLRVDGQIDERKNIVSSTKGAALYLKKHQSHLDNWACALVSYQMGLGGARNYFKDRYRGQRVMDIDRNSHWYLKKFLAHKVAFEGQLGKLVSNGDYLHEYPVNGPTTLAALARELGVSETHLKEFNKWTSNGKIPGDRPYTVAYIRKNPAPERPLLVSNNLENNSAIYEKAGAFPVITGNTREAHEPGAIKINGRRGVKATRTVSLAEFSEQTGIRKNRIRRLNDLKKSDKIVAGKYYYTQRKKGKAQVKEHVVRPGETLWEISQLYGIRLHSLKAKNRIYNDADIRPGMVLLLQEYRGRNEGIRYRQPAAPTTPAPREKAPDRINPVPASQAPPLLTEGPEETKPSVISHKIQAGETLYALSRKYKVSVDEIRAWNNLDNESILSIGQVIIIKNY